MTSRNDSIRYEYECAKGCAIGSDKPLDHCLFWPHERDGVPIKRVGHGSRKANKQENEK